MPHWSLRKTVRSCLTPIAALTAIIHFAVTGQHFAEYWLFGLFMLVAAWGQLVFAVASLAKPIRTTWWAGAIGNALIVVVYIVTRTVGDVVGPTPANVEPLGFGDVACTVAEVLVVAGCVWMLLSKADRPLKLLAIAIPVGVTIVAATLLSVSLVDGGPEMMMPMKSAASRSARTVASTLRSSGASQARGAEAFSGSTDGFVGQAAQGSDGAMPDLASMIIVMKLSG